jgi:tetratricopeptide (TPR) repeat protein
MHARARTHTHAHARNAHAAAAAARAAASTPPSSRRASASAAAAATPDATRADIAAATALLASARAADAAGEYAAALERYTAVATRHPSLALAHTAWLSAALLLFQTGAKDSALLELESESVDVGAGNAQLHAALAVVLHAQRPAQLPRAEGEWAAATALAPRYNDVAWVRESKGWPPAMLDALTAFITLS